MDARGPCAKAWLVGVTLKAGAAAARRPLILFSFSTPYNNRFLRKVPFHPEPRGTAVGHELFPRTESPLCGSSRNLSLSAYQNGTAPADGALALSCRGRWSSL